MKIQTSLKKLFISQTRVKLLGIFFTAPKEIFYVRQLVRLAEEEINSVRRELANLKNANIITSEVRGNRLYYFPNQNHPLYFDLLVLISKTTGLFSDLFDKKNQTGTLKLLFSSLSYLTWSFAQDKSEIDLVIVGNLSAREIEKFIKAEEDKRQREINYMIMDKSEFHLRRQKRDPLLVDFFLKSPLIIFGEPGGF